MDLPEDRLDCTKRSSGLCQRSSGLCRDLLDCTFGIVWIVPWSVNLLICVGDFSFNPQKETFDAEQFDLGIKKAAECQANDLKTHFIIAGDYYFYPEHEEKMKSMILNKMKKYGIKDAKVTIYYDDSLCDLGRKIRNIWFL